MFAVLDSTRGSEKGEEHGYTDAVKAQEVGHGIVPSAAMAAPVETFTIWSEPGADGAANLLMEWERTRVTIPVTPGK